VRAWQCRALAGLDGIELVDIELPEPGPDEVRIRVVGAGVNFADLLMLKGKYQEKPPLPFVPGLELAGVVDCLGPRTDGPKPGTRVMALVDRGAFGEFAVARVSDTFVVPDGVDLREAAGFGITFGTAIGALDWRADLQAGDTLLVHGAGGGVGVAAVSCGRAMGAKVIATARGETKLAAARERGAMHTLDSDDPDLVERIKALAPNRIDVVFDPVGGTMFEASLRTIAWEGRIVTIGFASGDIPQIPANHLLVKNAAVLGLYWGSYRKHDPQRVRAGFQRLFGWAACGELGSLAVEAIPFEEGSEALAALAGRRAVGKLVLAMDGAA